MYLKRLEIQGFKSFPDKIRLDFEKGISAIVGPNGSGKSNVSDAIRWVLGEQSARSLRGQKMEDIIFAGTQNRRSLGFAEVCLILDNTDREINLDFAEINVTRRVYRTGESQFFINNANCRLRDIHELFMDTGIGREGYSIIGQGKIDEILSVKSEDRRELFEEAAGIVKYRTRKNEAESKLEKEQQNLIRVNDIIAELEVQLEPLREQSDKAKLFIEITEKLKIISVNIFVGHVEREQQVTQSHNESIESIKESIRLETETQNRGKAEAEAKKIEIAGIDKKIAEQNYKINDKNLNMERAENAVKMLEQNIEFLNKDIEKYENDNTLMEKSVNSLEIQAAELEAKFTEGNTELQKINSELAVKLSELEKNEALVLHKEKRIHTFTKEHYGHLSRINELELRMQKAETEYGLLEEKVESLNESSEEIKSKILSSKQDIAALTEEAKAKSEKKIKLNNDNSFLTEEKVRLDREEQKLETEFNKLNTSLKETISKHKILVDFENSYEGYYKSVKKILSLKKEKRLFKGVQGAVAALMKTPEKFETAIETALGSSLQNLITETEQDAKEAIEYLKKNNEGRATFLPITSVRQKDSLDKKQFDREAGFIDIAKNVISFDNRHDGIFGSLLGKTLLFDHIDNGIAYAKKSGYKFRLVTLEGDILNAGGSMQGGSVAKNSGGILSRAREIEKLADEIEKIRYKKDCTEAELNEAHLKCSAVSEKIDQNRFIIHENEIQINTVSIKITQKENELKKLSEDLINAEKEIKIRMESIGETNKLIRELQAQYSDAKKEIESLLRNLESLKEDVQFERKNSSVLNKEVTSLKVSMSRFSESNKSIKQNIEILRKQRLDFTGSIERNNKRIEADRVVILQKRNDIQIKLEEIKSLSNSDKYLFSELDRLKNEKHTKNTEISELESLNQKKYEIISSLSNELTKLQIRKEQAEADLRKLYDEMWDNYGLTYQAALKVERISETPAFLIKEEKRLKNEIRDLGHVNVNAIEEYINIKERYEFLSSQRNDIVLAEEKLKGIIFELSEQMKKQFSIQFKAISESFGEVFKEIFGGGTAHLQLSDETDILNSGIDIIARPPGKSLQNMMLFSGGERALTAIALLFAILKLKPSPFCILDEIESALDDANVNRFADYLKKISSTSQFIVITHRKGTMEASDVLYGITMQEKGVSKLVSVKFD